MLPTCANHPFHSSNIPRLPILSLPPSLTTPHSDCHIGECLGRSWIHDHCGFQGCGCRSGNFYYISFCVRHCWKWSFPYCCCGDDGFSLMMMLVLRASKECITYPTSLWPVLPPVIPLIHVLLCSSFSIFPVAHQLNHQAHIVTDRAQGTGRPARYH